MQAKKTIAIDVREASVKAQGKGRYTFEIVKALLKESPETEFCLITATPELLFPEAKNAKQICLHGKGLFWHLNLRSYLKKNPVDFFLAPTSYIYPAIAPKTQKTALIIHDLITFLHPSGHPFFPTLVERLTLKRTLKKATCIFTVSKNTLKDLHTIFPFTKNKPSAIAYPAVSAEIKRTENKKMDLPQNFILAIGTLPRKNNKILIEAFNDLNATSQNHDLHLCIAGPTPKHHSSQKNSYIHFLGTVSQSELCELYSRAQMLVFPSLYEGFGMPPLEALACGCPVIVSNTSSLPEVVGTSGIQVDPTNKTSITKAIQTLLKDQEAQHKKSPPQALNFSWETSAREILKHIILPHTR